MASLQKIRTTLTGTVPGDTLVHSGAFVYRKVSRIVTTGVIILLFVPVILVWTVVVAGLFGYQVVDTHGMSMDPVLVDGDAVWGKMANVSEIEAGDIVTLGSAEVSITHRIVVTEQLPDRNYYITTKGDANEFTEGWTINPDTEIPVITGRIPFGGYVLRFISGTTCKIVLGLIAVLSVILLVYRKHSKLSNEMIMNTSNSRG